MHAQIKHSLGHLQDLISTFAGIKYTSDKVGIKSCRCTRECFIYACIWL